MNTSDFLASALGPDCLTPEDFGLETKTSSYELELRSLGELLRTKAASTNAPPRAVGGIGNGNLEDPKWPESALGIKPKSKDVEARNDTARPQEVSPKTAGLAVPKGIQRMAARQRAADAASAGRKGADRFFDAASYKAHQAKEHAARVAAKHKDKAEGGLFRSPATRRMVEASKTAALLRSLRTR